MTRKQQILTGCAVMSEAENRGQDLPEPELRSRKLARVGERGVEQCTFNMECANDGVRRKL